MIYKQHEIKIIPDEYAESPREWDNLGAIYTVKLRRWTIGEKHSLEVHEIKEIEASSKYIYKNVYKYEHSDISLSTEPYSCPWDSGKIGIIAVSKEKIRKWYNCKRISQKTIDTALEALTQEIKDYSTYLNGEVVGYQIYKSDSTELIDSCYGYYSEDAAVQDAKNIIDDYFKTTAVSSHYL